MAPGRGACGLMLAKPYALKKVPSLALVVEVHFVGRDPVAGLDHDNVASADHPGRIGEDLDFIRIDLEVAPLELDLTCQLDVILADAYLALADGVVETRHALGGHGPRSRNHE